MGADDRADRVPAVVRHGGGEGLVPPARHPGRHRDVGADDRAVRPGALVVPAGHLALAGALHGGLDLPAQPRFLCLRTFRLYGGDHWPAGGGPAAAGLRAGGGALYRDLPGDHLRLGGQCDPLAAAGRAEPRQAGPRHLAAGHAGRARRDRPAPAAAAGAAQRAEQDCRGRCAARPCLVRRRARAAPGRRPGVALARPAQPVAHRARRGPATGAAERRGRAPGGALAGRAGQRPGRNRSGVDAGAARGVGAGRGRAAVEQRPAVPADPLLGAAAQGGECREGHARGGQRRGRGAGGQRRYPVLAPRPADGAVLRYA